MNFEHISVLLNEAVASLSIKPDGIYVDATAGGGGHSAEIARRLDKGRLIAIDRDPDAISVLKEKFSYTPNVTVVQGNFSSIKQILHDLSIGGVDGILADLGVSSHQLDTPERGFSFHNDAPLDMRMSQQGMTAADIVNSFTERELADILFRFGEEKFSKRIAANIVKARQSSPITTTFELVDIIKASMPQRAMRDSHPARRSFQALRIAVNSELDILPRALDDMFSSLNKDGILSVISFHSLEDRIIKQKFAQLCQGCICPKDFPVCQCNHQPEGSLCFKSIAPSEEEIAKNPRSRSARLRAIRRL